MGKLQSLLYNNLQKLYNIVFFLVCIYLYSHKIMRGHDDFLGCAVVTCHLFYSYKAKLEERILTCYKTSWDLSNLDQYES